MIDELRKKSLGLPMLPGVYIMKDIQGRVIYVGKAARLKNRVSSYFSGLHDLKTEAMVSKVNDFEVIVAASEFEALVLENSLIKHHLPKYNIKLRDDKGYPYVRVDVGNEYPAFRIVSKPENDNALYLGPYSGRQIIREAIEAICKALKLPTCGKNIKRMIGKERPCLNAHIGTCKAYCQDASLVGSHRESVEAAIDILKGKTAGLIEKITNEMYEAAESQSFEVAAEKRDRLRALQMLEQKQLVIAGAMADTDVVGFYRGSAKACFTVLHYIDGKLISKDFELLESPIEEDSEAVSGFVRLYYEQRGVMPRNIILPEVDSDIELLEMLFSEKAGRRIYVQSPKRGDKAKLIEIANINAREEAERASTQEERTTKTLEWLQRALRLETSPDRIEAYDVSNTGSSDIVASMTVFVKGRLLKKDCRRFKIKSIKTQDDYHSIEEAITRRVGRFLANDLKFGYLPTLMLIDGGAVHASAAQSVLKNAGINLPVFGMVKDNKHRVRALVSPAGEEIGVSANPAAFALIGTISEETHKFAIEYHRQLRSKSSYKSKLDSIHGVGEMRRNKLTKEFGSIKAIAAATEDELAAVVPRSTAKSVFEFFNGQKGGEREL